MSKGYYPEVNPNPDFAKLEESVLATWQAKKLFAQSVENRPALKNGQNNEYVFYDGPPFANGLPHYGHLLTGYVKDVFARYHTMLGKRVERRFGWDCHGLPAEMGSEKELGISGRNAIMHFGIANFNEHCRTSVMKYTHEWETYVTRQARWVDFAGDYKTMDKNFMESVLWAFSEIYKKGWVYEAYRVMPYSWAAETPLSNFETKLDNSYREREDKAATVAFRLKEKPKGAPDGCSAYKILAWTTTPWTLPSNLALAVSKNVAYSYTIKDGVCYIHGANAAKGLNKVLVDGDTVIETPRLILRQFKQEDYPLFAALMADADVNALLKTVTDEETNKKLFAGMLEQYKKDGYSKWAVFEKGTGAFVGRAGVNKVAGVDGLTEVGYILRKEFWGKGYATELAKACYDYAVMHLGLQDVYSLCHAENKPSAAVMKKFGLAYKDDIFYPFLGDERNRYSISREDYLAQNAISGESLVGLSYTPLFPYFANHQQGIAFKILDGSSFVTDSEGTGIVHMAPGFGEDDQRCCAENGIDVVVPVDGQGKYTDAIFDVMLETDRLYARPFTAKDADLLFGLHSSPEVGNTTVDGPQTREQSDADLKRFIAHQEKHGYSQWAVFDKATGEFAGRGGLVLRALDEAAPEQVEIRYALHAKFWGKGYATELGKAMLQWGFAQSGVERIVAGANPAAKPSNRVLEKLGLTYVKNITYGGKECTYYTMDKPDGAAQKAPLFLQGLNVIAQTEGQLATEPYKPEQVKKFGLANLRIISWLKEHGKLIKQEEFKHNYPHCWRTDTPLIYRAMPSWYVEVTKFRDRAVELNKEINWIPAHVRDGQMGHMLATAPDWSISRNRFWGTPIPVWRSKSGKIKVCGSIAEIETLSGKKVEDLHRPYIDEVTFDIDGETYTRVEDVFDCWFESGSMPFAQVHYPFENKEWFEHHFPADFITEYVGQTRGWFNTLIMLSTALFDKIPFKNCICHGVVLDAETGLKYSKRLKNYKDPLEVINQFGADALRWLMIASPVMRGQDLMVDPDGKFIRDVVRLAIKPIWNAYNFFSLYANADGVKAHVIESSDVVDVMDRYILAKCSQAVAHMRTALDAYDTPTACDAVTAFFDSLNNWYIRRNKERFWKTDHDADKQAAYDTLYTVLTTMCRAAAPLLPLTLEEIYRGLTGDASVHLADFPSTTDFKDCSESNLYDSSISERMDYARLVCSTAHSIRNSQGIRVRQPLNSLTIYSELETVLELSPSLKKEELQVYLDIIAEEVNVKNVYFSRKMDFVANKSLEIYSREVGKRIGDKLKQVIPAAKKGEWKITDTDEIAGIRLPIEVEVVGIKLYNQYSSNFGEDPVTEFWIKLTPKNTKNSEAIPNTSELLVLDTTITPELEAEGIARDMVRMIQQARKDADLNVSDRIRLHVDAPEAIAKAVAAHKDYVNEQTLSVMAEKALDKPVFTTENTLDDQKVVISFSLAA